MKMVRANIENILNERFKLQSTKNNLESLNLNTNFVSFNSFISNNSNKLKISVMDEKTQNLFLKTIGGGVYYKEAHKLIRTILSK